MSLGVAAPIRGPHLGMPRFPTPISCDSCNPTKPSIPCNDESDSGGESLTLERQRVHAGHCCGVHPSASPARNAYVHGGSEHDYKYADITYPSWDLSLMRCACCH
jgi:hypothetical protein